MHHGYTLIHAWVVHCHAWIESAWMVFLVIMYVMQCTCSDALTMCMYTCTCIYTSVCIHVHVYTRGKSINYMYTYVCEQFGHVYIGTYVWLYIILLDFPFHVGMQQRAFSHCVRRINWPPALGFHPGSPSLWMIFVPSLDWSLIWDWSIFQH